MNWGPWDTSPTLDRLCDLKTLAAIRGVVEEWSHSLRTSRASSGFPLTADLFTAEGVVYARELRGNLLPVLQREVFAKLSRPYTLLPREVAEFAGDHLSVLPDNLDVAILRFLHACRFRELGAYVQRSEPFVVQTFDKDECFPNEEVSLYTSESGFEVFVAGFVPAATLGDPANLPTVEMRVALSARCSQEAMAEAVREMQPLLTSVLRSLTLSGHFQFVDSDNGEEPRADQTGFDLLADCLDAYFTAPSKKDLLGGRRLRNAIRLLIEADAAQHNIVSLALCMSALEAMVVSGTGEISEQLARNTASLLQPDPHQRPANVAAIKRLYNLRSRLLHGETVDDNGAGVAEARQLASAAVKAVLEWRRWKRRLGDDSEKSVEFLEELTHAGLAGRAMMGVPEELAACLPKNGETTGS